MTSCRAVRACKLGRKQAEQEARAREARLARAAEEVERYKALLQEVKVQVRLCTVVAAGFGEKHSGRIVLRNRQAYAVKTLNAAVSAPWCSSFPTNRPH